MLEHLPECAGRIFAQFYISHTGAAAVGISPETRRLIKILPEDAQITSEMFDLLLGDNLAGRKDYISENGYLYMDSTDLS